MWDKKCTVHWIGILRPWNVVEVWLLEYWLTKRMIIGILINEKLKDGFLQETSWNKKKKIERNSYIFIYKLFFLSNINFYKVTRNNWW